MTTTVWGAIQRSNLKALADYERDYSTRVIPVDTPILVWGKVSWWRFWASVPPRTEAWASGNFDPAQVASFCLPAGSDAERAFAVWQQPSTRRY
jgi:hypothetical protein